MRADRRVTALAILILYVAQTVGAQAVHVWQCSHGCDNNPQRPGAVSDQPHCHHHGCTHGPPVEPDGSSPEDQGDNRHDSSRCAVCQIIALAQDKPVLADVECSGDITTSPLTLIPGRNPGRAFSRLRSRGPPMRPSKAETA